MPRNPVEVIDAIKPIIPDGNTALLSKLEWVRNNACFTAPEGMYLVWRQLASALEGNLNVPPVHDWEKRIQGIVVGGAKP